MVQFDPTLQLLSISRSNGPTTISSYFLVDQIVLTYSKAYRLTIMYIYYLLYDNG